MRISAEVICISGFAGIYEMRYQRFAASGMHLATSIAVNGGEGAETVKYRRQL